AIAALSPEKRLPVLAVSASEPEKTGLQVQGPLLSGFLRKPYSPADLHHALIAAIEGHRSAS
ncbi:MAG: hypothetical protein AAGF59_13910, partial [Pseudomonadota bacterium]